MTRRRRIQVTAAIALALAVPYYACDGEHRVLVAAASPDKTAALDDGFVHYQLNRTLHPTVPVVLIHGASGAAFIWDHTYPALVAAGHTVLRYDLYGRGTSSRPDITYDQDLFDRQLANLLTSLHFEGPVDLVGVSMGGMVATYFADRHPDRVRKLCLIDPLGFPMTHSFGEGALRVPLIGDYVFTVIGDKSVLKHNLEYLKQPELYPEFPGKFGEQLTYKGYKRAFLSTVRNVPLEDMQAVYERVGKKKRPTLLIWGRGDRTVPFSNSERARELLPGAEFVAVDDAAHVPQYEKPEIVNPKLLEFLARKQD